MLRLTGLRTRVPVWNRALIRCEGASHSHGRHFSAAFRRSILGGFESTLPHAVWGVAQDFMEEKATVEKKFENIDQLTPAEVGQLSKGLMKISPAVTAIERVQELAQELEGLMEVLDDAETAKDPEMLEMAISERDDVLDRLRDEEASLVQFLLPPDEDDDRNAVLEVRAGTGGEEAALFAMEIFHMYEKFCKRQGWSFKTTSTHAADQGGYREASAMVSGHNIFCSLKFETGVHRVQRIPATETQGRLHTSAATVAILPEAEEVDVVVNAADLRIDTYRSSGAGGQHVNCTDSAIRIVHGPTGIVVTCQDERSQQMNKDKALRLLYTKLYEKQKAEEHEKRASERSAQVGRGDRSERIRTYNFPQSRITDHRVGSSKFGIERMMAGELLCDFIEDLTQASRTQKLEALESASRRED